MELWNIASDMVPWNHEYYVRFNTYRPWDGVQLLEVTPEHTFGAPPADEIIYNSNNYAAREELSCYSDGEGGTCADHITVERGMLCVPLWKDDETGSAGGYHPAAIVGLSLLSRMDDYPLLDEDDYSEREYNAWLEYLSDEFNWADDGDREDEEINSHLARFIEYGLEHFIGYFSVYDVPTEYLERAYTATRENDND